MKTILKIGIVLVSLFSGILTLYFTGNIIAFALATYATSAALQAVTNVSLEGLTALMLVLAPIKKTSSGTPNPGGGRKVWICAVDRFTADWGTDAVNGKISVAPTLLPDSGFVELEVSDNSLKLDQALKGAVGYQAFETSFEMKIAGDYEHQTSAVEKLINTEVVAVFQLNDLQRKTVGSTIFPLTFEISHTTGAKGSDQRGWTLKAKQDGLAKPSFFLASTVTLVLQEEADAGA